MVINHGGSGWKSNGVWGALLTDNCQVGVSSQLQQGQERSLLPDAAATRFRPRSSLSPVQTGLGILVLSNHKFFHYYWRPLLSADNLCIQFWQRSGPTKYWSWSGSKPFDRKEFFEKVILKKVNRWQQQHENLYSMQRVNYIFVLWVISVWVAE